MDLIEPTYTIQWVGPMDYEEYREYLRNQETLDSAFLNFHRTPIFQKSQYLRIHRRFSPFSTQLYHFRLAPSEPPATSPRVVRTSPGLVFSKPGLVSPTCRVKNPECQVVPAAHAVACEGLKKAWWMLEESTVNAWWRLCGDYAIYVNFPLFTVHPFTKCAFPDEYQGENVWRFAVTSLHSGAWSQGAVWRLGNASLHTVSHWKSRINAYNVKGWTVKRGKFTYIELLMSGKSSRPSGCAPEGQQPDGHGGLTCWGFNVYRHSWTFTGLQ